MKNLHYRFTRIPGLPDYMKTSTIGLQESQGLPDYMKTSTIGLQESQGLPDYMKNLH